MKETASMHVALAPSRLLTGWLIGLHAISLVPLWWADLPAPAPSVLAVAIVAHGAWSAWRAGRLRSPHSITRIELGADAGCTLIARNGVRFDGAVSGSTVILGFLVVLAVNADGGRATRRAIVVRDMLAVDDFRRLRVALKWGGAQAPGGSHA
ncbi:MAG: hypothetical protein IPO58_03565 [Betaproteobacteria bacterium]|nr:hypothetical protein [Betaproteobacteria bacterium]